MIVKMTKNIITALSNFNIEKNKSNKQEVRYDFEHPFMADDYYIEIVHNKMDDKYKIEAHFSGKIVFPDKELLKSYSSWALHQYKIYYQEEYKKHWLESEWISFKELGVKIIDVIKVANDFSHYCVW